MKHWLNIPLCQSLSRREFPDRGAAYPQGLRRRLLGLGVLWATSLGCSSRASELEFEGRWQLVEKQLETDGCQLVAPSLRGQPCQLTCDSVDVRSTGALTWEMQFIDRGGTADCTALPGGTFDCIAEDTRGPSDAKVHRVDRMSGRPQADGSIQGTFALRMACTGPGCSLHPAFAQKDHCETQGTFRGVRSSGE